MAEHKNRGVTPVVETKALAVSIDAHVRALRVAFGLERDANPTAAADRAVMRAFRSTERMKMISDA